MAGAGSVLLVAIMAEVGRHLTLGLDPGRPWLGPAWAHTAYALGLLIFRPGWLLASPAVAGPAQDRTWIWSLGPGFVVLGGTLLLATISRHFSGSPTDLPQLSLGPLAWYLWIPVVEEIVYRVGFGAGLRRFMGPLVGGYWTAVCFSLAHSVPTLDRLLSLQWSLPLGPFLLGLACEWVYQKSRRRIFAPIILHSACNLTSVVFSAADSRWLDWLAPLYGT